MTPTLPVPDRLVFTSGTGTGSTELAALDAAFAAAGIEDANVLRVSSVVPAGATVETGVPPADLREAVVPGGLYPVVYGEATTTTPGESVHAAVAGAWLGAGHGVNVEVAGTGDDPDAAREECRALLDELAAHRDDHVEQPAGFEYAATTLDGDAEDRAACAVAAVVYL